MQRTLQRLLTSHICIGAFLPEFLDEDSVPLYSYGDQGVLNQSQIDSEKRM